MSETLRVLREAIKQAGDSNNVPLFRGFAELLALKLEKLESERTLLAKLASDTPQFDNPLVAWKAQEIRDEILSESLPHV